MKAILLAGGMGTRLRSVVTDLPKPMAPVAGKPFLEILLSHLILQGIDDITLSVGYKHEVISNHFGDSYSGVPIRYCIEKEPLGTGGALKLACLQSRGDEPVFVLNADTYVEVDLAEMYRICMQPGTDVGMVLRRLEDVSRYGQVCLNDAQTRVVSFSEKSAGSFALVNMGVYLMRPSLFDRFELPDTFSLEHDLFVKHVDTLAITPWVTDGYFIDIGIPDDYHRAQSELPGQ